MVQVWRQGRVRAIERVQCPLEADALVLDHLARLGCDPSAARECRHYLYVSSEFGARTVAWSLGREGWDVDHERIGRTWLVTASTRTNLSDDIVRTTRDRLEALAAEHGGHYDGWEAAAD